MSLMKAPPNHAAHVFVPATQMGQPVRTAQQGTSSGLLAGAAPTLPAWASLPHAAHTRHRSSFLRGIRANWPRVISGPPGDCLEPMRAAAPVSQQHLHGCPCHESGRVAFWPGWALRSPALRSVPTCLLPRPGRSIFWSQWQRIPRWGLGSQEVAGSLVFEENEKLICRETDGGAAFGRTTIWGTVWGHLTCRDITKSQRPLPVPRSPRAPSPSFGVIRKQLVKLGDGSTWQEASSRGGGGALPQFCCC